MPYKSSIIGNRILSFKVDSIHLMSVWLDRSFKLYGGFMASNTLLHFVSLIKTGIFTTK